MGTLTVLNEEGGVHSIKNVTVFGVKNGVLYVTSMFQGKEDQHGFKSWLRYTYQED